MDGIFSYFETRAPIQSDLEENIECVSITPIDWDPNSNHFSHNEEQLMTIDGEVGSYSNGENKSIDIFLVSED